MGFKIPDKSTVDHSFHGFTDATCQRNRTIIGRIRGILNGLWNRNHNCEVFRSVVRLEKVKLVRRRNNSQ